MKRSSFVGMTARVLLGCLSIWARIVSVEAWSSFLPGATTSTHASSFSSATYNHHARQQRGGVRHVSSSFGASSPSSLVGTTPSTTSTRLQASADHNNDPNISTESSCTTLRRLGLTGVSVSPHGFTVLWGFTTNNDDNDSRLYWPWHVTTAQAGDRQAVTSAQALTLCQLIAGIDLAGSRLPADILAQVTVLSCEEGPQDTTKWRDNTEVAEVAQPLVEDVQKQVQRIHQKWFSKEAAPKSLSYTDAPAWIRARVSLPLCTLDQIDVEPMSSDDGDDSSDNNHGTMHVTYHVQVKGYGSLVISHVTDQVLASVLGPLYDDYTFSDDTRKAFLTTALSLRYKAPVLLEIADEENDDDDDDDDNNNSSSSNNSHIFVQDVTKAFPLYTTVQKVQTPSDRVVSRIEKGWEVHQLQAAYQIALQKNDMAAVAKIREKLDEMDAMPDLPVQEDSELDSMQ